MDFTKTPQAFSDQINLLKSRGLKIDNEEFAIRYLENISYYRLSAYFLTFQIHGDPNHNYIKSATFKNVINLYVFDRELRNILLDGIERIEVALRCRLVYEYCHKYGNNWYENSTLFLRKHRQFMDLLQNELKGSKEVFISHYFNKYTNPHNPPAWMAIEILSFGQVSTLYKNLATNDAKKSIASHFGVSVPVLESWIEHLVYIRNICAHHGRLWNRIMTVKAVIPSNPIKKWITIAPSKPDKLYTTLSIASYLLNIIGNNPIFVGKVKVLLKRFDEIDIDSAGFPANWKHDNFWKSIPLGITHQARLFLFSFYKFK
ncbi:MAG: Abi family protein [Bacteroidota bacterium]|nr:Abi family protein [Bacteroidota bacterium]